jgi:hypothetical protein
VIEGIDRTDLGATDAGDGRDEREATRLACRRTERLLKLSEQVDARCPVCRVTVGHWSRVHYASATEQKPCRGSW